MSFFVQHLWLVPALPAAGFLVLGLLGRRFPRKAVAGIACGAMLGAFLCSALAAIPVLSHQVVDLPTAEGLVVDEAASSVEVTLWEWLPGGVSHGAAPGAPVGSVFASRLSVPLGFLLDPLSAIMILVVTGVGFLIHVYAAGYMWEEQGYARFFTYLNLFVTMMLLLVLGSSFVLMFVGWEGVGLCSYLLIGFYHRQEVPPTAGMKAFLVNRIGDFGFVLGLLFLFVTFGTLQYTELFPRVAGAAGFAGSALAACIALLLFVGATGKSAQLPLFVWLPDAMAGPTPVSALIHAATMVTAGVYLIIRANVLFQAAPVASGIVAVVGVLTALVAATIALVQNDIKKVLAYSTVSQLGLMFLAVGVGAYAAGLFHLVTHAFFKALLFLGAGSVSHALGGELDLRKMGGLRAELPHTHRVILVATIAIAGIPPLAGFWSKDEILAGVVMSTFPAGLRWGLWIAAIAGALLTAFYMFRMYFLAFSGSQRWTSGTHPHESPASMLGPLYVLAGLALAGGALGLAAWTQLPNWLHGQMAHVVHAAGALVSGGGAHLSVGEELLLALAATVVAAGGAFLAFSWYHRESAAPAGLAGSYPRLHALLLGKYRVDEAYDVLFVRPFVRIADWSAGLDRRVLDERLVTAPGLMASLAGEAFRAVSSGRVRTHALGVVAGIVLLLAWIVLS